MKSWGHWGLSREMVEFADFTPSICTYCDLLERYMTKKHWTILSLFHLFQVFSWYVMTLNIECHDEVEKDWKTLFFTIKCRVTRLGEFKDNLVCWFFLEETILIFINNFMYMKALKILDCNAFEGFVKKG